MGRPKGWADTGILWAEPGQTRTARAEGLWQGLQFTAVALGHSRHAFGGSAASVLCFGFDGVIGPLDHAVRPQASDLLSLGSLPFLSRERAGGQDLRGL